MPLFNVVCGACSKTDRRMCRSESDLMNLKCRECEGPVTRHPDPPTTQVKEVLDNGIMTKRLERYADAERLARDNAKVR